jgi:hypothetical protein
MKFFLPFFLLLIPHQSEAQHYLNDSTFFEVDGYFDTIYKLGSDRAFLDSEWKQSFNKLSRKKLKRNSVQQKFETSFNKLIQKNSEQSNNRLSINGNKADSSFTILWVARIKDISLRTPQYSEPIWFREGTLIRYIQNESPHLTYIIKKENRIKKMVLYYHWLVKLYP